MTLPNEDNVYRMVSKNQRASKHSMDPSIGSFTPTANDEGKLSVDYEKLTTAEESLARFGATYKFGKTEFKDPLNFDVYSINIGFVSSFDAVKGVFADPIINTPPIKGTPNNVAHSLIDMTQATVEDEPELYSKIQEHAKERKIQTIDSVVLELTEKLRKQLD